MTAFQSSSSHQPPRQVIGVVMPLVPPRGRVRIAINGSSGTMFPRQPRVARHLTSSAMQPPPLDYHRPVPRRRRRSPLSVLVAIVGVWAFLGGSVAIFGDQSGIGSVPAVLGLVILVISPGRTGRGNLFFSPISFSASLAGGAAQPCAFNRPFEFRSCCWMPDRLIHSCGSSPHSLLRRATANALHDGVGTCPCGAAIINGSDRGRLFPFTISRRQTRLPKHRPTA